MRRYTLFPSGFNLSIVIVSITSVLLFISCASQVSFAQNPPTETLELNKPLEREIGGKTKQLYQLNLAENQYAKIIIEQRGINVVAQLFGVDEKPLAKFNADIRTSGKEEIELVADVAGIYKIEVRPDYFVLPSGRYEIRLVELREAAANDKLLQEARIAYSESANLRQQGKMKDAFAKIKHALEIRENILGKDNVEVAATLDTAAFFYFSMGDMATSESMLQRSLDIKEKKLEPNDPEIAQTLNSFGLITSEKGDYAKAEMYFKRAIEIREKSLGKDHPGVATSINSLAALYIDLADYQKAEPLFLRSLEIEEKIYGKNSLDTANVINNLGLLNSERGDYDKALEFYQKALEINEKFLPSDHPSIALSLNNVATIYQKKNDFAKSEPLLLRALAIREKTFGADSPDVAQTLYNIGGSYFLTDNFEKAEQMFKRSLTILEAKLGTEHIFLNYPLKSLGGLYRNKGEYDKSEEYFQRVIKIREKVLGSFHPDLAGDLTSLGILYAAKGMADKSVAALNRASEINERALTLNLAVGSEKQKLAYISKLEESTDQILSIQNQSFPNDVKARELAVTTILQRKGRVQDALADTFGNLKQRLGSKDKKLFDELNEINSKLANLVLNGQEEMSSDKYQAQVKTLEEQKEKLEEEISRNSAEYAAQVNPVTLETVRNSLDNDTALVEFAVYRLFNPKSKTKKDELTEPRYAAYIITKQGDVKSLDLGEAKIINSFIENYRQAAADPKRQDYKKIARDLDEKLMSPIRKLIGDKKHLLISPDGELNLIPFEALFDENGKFLVENYSISYLTSGRDLLRMQIQRDNKDKSLIVANPFFGISDEPFAAKTRKAQSNKNEKRRSITAARNLSDTFFAPISGTEREARSIKILFPEATLLTESQATETAIKKINAPKILHIATHGFFLEDGDSAETNKMSVENPLLRSGLAFAGANQRGKDGANDGILTALEASGLNLWGTKLVVLSACDTGLGDVKNGEGVYGLRRSFVLAGTESLIMSLWSVSDDVTRELMTSYYKNLKAGIGRGESLRQVQLEMLKNPKHQHPFYWSSFIQSGEWANLDGRR